METNRPAFFKKAFGTGKTGITVGGRLGVGARKVISFPPGRIDKRESGGYCSNEQLCKP